jgi:hypothetical protein
MAALLGRAYRCYDTPAAPKPLVYENAPHEKLPKLDMTQPEMRRTVTRRAFTVIVNHELRSGRPIQLVELANHIRAIA